MAWVKLDDAMPHHPKVMAAGPQAFALDVAGICYSNKHATDGFIAAASLPAVLPSLPQPRKWARKLVEVGRWHEVDGGWSIHDVADYQPTAEQQKEISRKRAAAGRIGGSKSGESRRSNTEATPKQVASTDANPDPTRPEVPSEPPPQPPRDEPTAPPPGEGEDYALKALNHLRGSMPAELSGFTADYDLKAAIDQALALGWTPKRLADAVAARGWRGVHNPSKAAIARIHALGAPPPPQRPPQRTLVADTPGDPEVGRRHLEAIRAQLKPTAVEKEAS